MTISRITSLALRLAVALAILLAFVFTPGAQAQGDVSGLFQPPVEGVTVHLTRDGSKVRETKTAADGTFRFANVAPGSYQASVADWPSAQGPPPPPQSFTIGARGTKKGILELWIEDATGLWQDHRPKILGVLALLAALLIGRQLIRMRSTVPKLPPAGSDAPTFDEIDQARDEIDELDEVRERMSPIAAYPRMAMQLLLSYRDAGDWTRMYALIKQLPSHLAKLSLVRQQLGFALNRDGQDIQAEKTLRKHLAHPSGRTAETYGILARVYKDRWEKARAAGDKERASKLLDQAVETYIAGFDCDPRNPYPGLNALTLMEYYDEPPPGKASLEREVQIAVNATYWSHAGKLEAAILSGQESEAREALTGTLEAPHTVWEVETTMRNLRLFRTARLEFGRPLAEWQKDVIAAVEDEAQP